MVQVRHTLTASVRWEDEPHCGDRLQVIAGVADPLAVQAILAH